MAKKPLIFHLLWMLTTVTVTNLRFLSTAARIIPPSPSPSPSPPVNISPAPPPLLSLSPHHHHHHHHQRHLPPPPPPPPPTTSPPPSPTPPKHSPSPSPTPPKHSPSPSPSPSINIPPLAPLLSPTPQLSHPTQRHLPPPPKVVLSHSMPKPPPPPPPPPSPGLLSSSSSSSSSGNIQEGQLGNIIDALIGAGDFGGWASILSSSSSLLLPLSATLFIPAGGSPLSDRLDKLDPLLMIPYHIVPQRLTFSQLQLFSNKTRLPTLLPSKTIVITNNSPSNFTVDDSAITHPDLYLTSGFALHGVRNILDYSLYGQGHGILISSDLPPPPPPPPPLQHRAPPFSPGGGDDQVMDNNNDDGDGDDKRKRKRSSDAAAAACSCTEFPIILSVACAAFAFKIHHRHLLL